MATPTSAPLAAAAIVALYLFALFPTPEFPAYNSDDGSYFVTLALNLLDHGRYSTDTWPGDPHGHHATWPPLHPLLLAGVISAAGLSWSAIKAVMAMIGLLGLYLWWRLFRNETCGTAAVLALSLSPAYFLFAHHPMTEVPFMALCAGVLLSLAAASTPARALGAGVLAAAAFMVRGYAVAFLPAALIWFATRGKTSVPRRLVLAAAFSVPLLLTIIAWQQYTSHILRSGLPLDGITTQYGNGTNLLAALAISPLQHLKNLYWFELRYPAHYVMPFVPLEAVLRSGPVVVVSIVAVVVAGIGWLERLRRLATPGDVWVPCLALLLYLLSVHSHGVRYWITLLPFGFLYLFNGFRVIAKVTKVSAIAPAGVGLVTLSVAVGLAVHLWQPDRLRFASSHWREYRDVAAWAAANLPADAAFVAHASHKFHAVTRRPVYPAERRESIESASAHRAVYALCGGGDDVPTAHRQWCVSNKSSLEVVFGAREVMLVRLK